MTNDSTFKRMQRRREIGEGNVFLVLGAIQLMGIPGLFSHLLEEWDKRTTTGRFVLIVEAVLTPILAVFAAAVGISVILIGLLFELPTIAAHGYRHVVYKDAE